MGGNLKNRNLKRIVYVFLGCCVVFVVLLGPTWTILLLPLSPLHASFSFLFSKKNYINVWIAFWIIFFLYLDCCNIDFFLNTYY